jgi:hypothetical protein
MLPEPAATTAFDGPDERNGSPSKLVSRSI